MSIAERVILLTCVAMPLCFGADDILVGLPSYEWPRVSVHITEMFLPNVGGQGGRSLTLHPVMDEVGQAVAVRIEFTGFKGSAERTVSMAAGNAIWQKFDEMGMRSLRDVPKHPVLVVSDGKLVRIAWQRGNSKGEFTVRGMLKEQGLDDGVQSVYRLYRWWYELCTNWERVVDEVVKATPEEEQTRQTTEELRDPGVLQQDPIRDPASAARLKELQELKGSGPIQDSESPPE